MAFLYGFQLLTRHGDEVRGVTVFPATGRLYVVSRATRDSIVPKPASIGDGGWTAFAPLEVRTCARAVK